MQPITEQEAWRTVGDIEPAVLEKFEDEVAQIAITLKQWPDWFILALHREVDDRLELYRIESESHARAEYISRVQRFEATGRLFDSTDTIK